MAASVLTFHTDNPEQSSSSAGLLNLTAPTASTSTTGWTVGVTAINNFSLQTFRSEVSFLNNATALPSVAPAGKAMDCWRISAATTGVFSAGTWYSSLSAIAVTNSSAQRGAALFRIWRSVNPDGTAATEITKSRMTGSTLAGTLLTTVAQSSSASTQVAGFSLANEYLFMQAAWQITTVGTNAGSDVLVRLGPWTDVTNGSGLVTSAFSATQAAATASSAYYKNQQQWFNSA